MIYALRGKITERKESFFVIETGGLAFKIFTNKRTLALMPIRAKEAEVFTCLYFRDEKPELYGFWDKQTRELFELLNTVSGVGPRTALGILDAGSADRVITAISEGKTDFLSRVSGVGRRTAERVVLELRNKVVPPKTTGFSKIIDSDNDVEEVLIGLGYQRRKAREVVDRLGAEPTKFEDRLKKALREVSK